MKSCFSNSFSLLFKLYGNTGILSVKMNTARAESSVIIIAAGKILLIARYPPIASPATPGAENNPAPDELSGVEQRESAPPPT